MQEDLRNKYFQNPYPNQGPPPPYNPVLQPYEQPEPRSSGNALAFWLFVMFGLMAIAAYFGYFAPLLAKLRAKIKELTPTPIPDTESPTRPAGLWYQMMKEEDEEVEWQEGEEVDDDDDEDEEGDKAEEADPNTTMLAQPDINDRFAKLMDGYGILDKSLMNGKIVGDELLNQQPDQKGDEN